MCCDRDMPEIEPRYVLCFFLGLTEIFVKTRVSGGYI